MEEKKIPAWKAFEDAEIRKAKEKEISLALFYIKEWLEKNEIIFTEGKGGNLISIPSNVLISRREMTKLMLMTKARLGIQFFNGEISIYKLGSKMTREESRASTQAFLDKHNSTNK